MTTSELPRVRVSRRAAVQVARGYAWIFANETDVSNVPEQRGAWCRFECEGRYVGMGYFNKHSLIAGRVVTIDERTDTEAILRERLTDAFARRKALVRRGCARLVFSESDQLPGLVVDWYGGVTVVQSNTAGMDTVLPIVERLIPAIHQEVLGSPLTALIVRGDSSVRQLEGVADFTRVVVGSESALRSGSFSEDGTMFAADFVRGQKTGFFLDQKDNRAHFDAMVGTRKIRSVLDLCCFSGGWGLRALRAGAEHVRFLDQSTEALALVRRGLELNSLAATRADLVERDVFAHLDADTMLYDAVIADPPAFVKSRKAVPQAIKGYEKLYRLAWRRVRPGGVLVACSCSYHLTEENFLELLASAVAKEHGAGCIVHRGFQCEDHPVLLAMPETRYLKCVVVEKG